MLFKLRIFIGTWMFSHLSSYRTNVRVERTKQVYDWVDLNWPNLGVEDGVKDVILYTIDDLLSTSTSS